MSLLYTLAFQVGLLLGCAQGFGIPADSGQIARLDLKSGGGNIIGDVRLFSGTAQNERDALLGHGPGNHQLGQGAIVFYQQVGPALEHVEDFLAVDRQIPWNLIAKNAFGKRLVHADFTR